MALVEKTTIKENLDLICLNKKKKVTLNKIKKMTEDKKKKPNRCEDVCRGPDPTVSVSTLEQNEGLKTLGAFLHS